jgi:putative membrane protein
MKSVHTPIALALSVALVSFGASAQTNKPAPTTPQSAGQPAQMEAGAHRPSNLASEDETFLENAIQGSHAEIEGSQLALEKTESSDVKAFAQMMIDDHGKMLKEAEALAKSKGIEPPTGPSVMQSTEITALKALSGGAFDAMYVNRIGVASHEATVEMFEKASREVQDPEIKAMATKTLPKLQEHLKMANALNAKQDKQ